jgi:hypothetical protein
LRLLEQRFPSKGQMMNSLRVTGVLTVYALLAIRCLAAELSHDAWIYKLDGTIQCDDRQGIPPELMAEQLRAQGITVLRSEKRRLPVRIPQECGYSRGSANAFLISASDWTRLENLGTLCFAVWAFDIGGP